MLKSQSGCILSTQGCTGAGNRRCPSSPSRILKVLQHTDRRGQCGSSSHLRPKQQAGRLWRIRGRFLLSFGPPAVTRGGGWGLSVVACGRSFHRISSCFDWPPHTGISALLARECYFLPSRGLRPVLLRYRDRHAGKRRLPSFSWFQRCDGNGGLSAI